MNGKNLVAIVLVLLIVGIIIFYQPLMNDDDNVARDNSNDDVTADSTPGVVLETSRLKDEPQDNLETLSEPLTELITETRFEPLEEATAEVAVGNSIRVNYIGWTAADGNIFDQSFNRGDEGFTFTVGQGVIEGWSQGTVGMKVGEVRRLKIPSELGYGEFGAGEDIPPNADLIFDVELLEIN